MIINDAALGCGLRRSEWRAHQSSSVWAASSYVSPGDNYGFRESVWGPQPPVWLPPPSVSRSKTAGVARVPTGVLVDGTHAPTPLTRTAWQIQQAQPLIFTGSGWRIRHFSPQRTPELFGPASRCKCRECKWGLMNFFETRGPRQPVHTFMFAPDELL